jgi:hypothetical protein
MFCAGNTPRFVVALTALTIVSLLIGPSRAHAADPVQWINTVYATPAGSTIQKVGGCGTCADAGATSSQSIASGDGAVQFAPVLGARLYAGLGATATASTDPALIDFAFSFWPDGGWDIREKNVYKTEGRFVSGDVFRVAIVGGAVKYYRNGVLVYSSAALPVYPLVVDTTLIGAGATVSNASVDGGVAPPAKVPVGVTTTSLASGVLAHP